MSRVYREVEARLTLERMVAHNARKQPDDTAIVFSEKRLPYSPDLKVLKSVLKERYRGLFGGSGG